jgi:hypothetical protein
MLEMSFRPYSDITSPSGMPGLHIVEVRIRWREQVSCIREQEETSHLYKYKDKHT